MAVADWTYRRWTGEPTSYLARTLVITRYALADVFKKRLTLAVYVACLLPPLVLGIFVYVSANLDTLARIIPGLANLPKGQFVKPGVYQFFAFAQAWFIVLWTLVAGPSLISRDLANNALALYLSKSVRVRDYVLGKWAALGLLLSGVSWLPLLLVFALHWGLSDSAWRAENGWIGRAILMVHVPLIVVVTAVVTAVAAHVRRRVFAQAAFAGVFVVTATLAGVLAAATRTSVAEVVSPLIMISRLAEWAFMARGGTVSLGPLVTVPALGAWVAVAVWVLARRLRPVEVVK